MVTHVTADVTLDQYRRMGRAEREAVPQSVRDRLRSELEARVGAMMAEQAQVEEQGDPDTNVAFRRLVGAVKAPMSPVALHKRIPKESYRGQSYEPCPSAQSLVGRDSRGVATVVTARCKQRGCAVCGRMWVDERSESVRLLAKNEEVRVLRYDVGERKWETLRKALGRHRAAGNRVDGVKFPARGGIVSVLVVLDAGDDKDLSPSLHGVELRADDLVGQARGLLLETVDAVVAGADVGPVNGLGRWNGKLTEPETPSEFELIAVLPMAMQVAEVKASIKRFGGRVGIVRDGSVQASFGSKVDEAHWLYWLGVTADEPDPLARGRCKPL